MLAGWKLRLLHLLSGTARLRTGILRSTCLAFLHLRSQSLPAWAVRRKDRQANSTPNLPVQLLRPTGHFCALNSSQSERSISAHTDSGISCTCLTAGADLLMCCCRRARAAYATWSEQWIADMKLEKPGLRQQQYKDLCWKAWQRSPDNPMNQM